MANYSELIQTINDSIKANGNQEITGPVLNSVLQAMVSALGEGYQFMGVATPDTNPGTPDGKVFYIAAKQGIYNNFGETEVVDIAKVIYNTASGWGAEDLSIVNVMAVAKNRAEQSFCQNRTLDKEERALWVGAFTDVKVVFESKPDGYPNIQIALSLVRRRSANSHEVRFKIKGSSGTWEYLGLSSQWVDEKAENPNGGSTLYEYNLTYLGSNVKLTCAIDWNAFGVGFSAFVDDALDAEPFYILSAKNIYLLDVNQFDPNEIDLGQYQYNLQDDNTHTFVPKVSAFDNAPSNVYVIKTPYKFSNNLNYKIEIGGIWGSPITGRFITATVEFWGRDNSTFDYYEPRVSWSEKTDIPIRLCTDSEGFICIAMGQDNNGSALFGFNFTIFVKKVWVNYFNAAIPANSVLVDGWNIERADALSAEYSNVYEIQARSAETLQNGYSVVTTNGNFARFSPLVFYKLGAAELPDGKVRIALPSYFTPARGASYKIDIAVWDIQFDRNSYTKAEVKFWGRSNAAVQYGICYKDSVFPFRIRVGLKDNRYYILVDGAYATNSILTIPEISVYSTPVENVPALMDDFEFSQYEEEDIADYTIYEPPVHQNVDREYLQKVVSQSLIMPVKPKSFAIFGSSKSTTRNAYTGWLHYLLDGLMKRANYISVVECGGNVSSRPWNDKAYTNTADGNREKKITGVGSSMRFNVYGSHVDIIQFIERTTDYAEFDIYDNGVKIGTYNNRNKTMLGSKTQTFNGNGTQKSFVLDYLESYDFEVNVDGSVKSVSNNPALTDDVDCFAVRTIMTFDPYNDGKPRRIIYFKDAPANGSSISVTYKVGQAIGFIQSDYAENDDGTSESMYPVYISSLTLDATNAGGYPLSPIVSNPNAVLRLSFNGYGQHDIEIRITGGVNPYFDFDFACAETNDFMNAAFGGYDLPRVISEPRWRDWRSIRYMPYFDALIMEYGTNDDRYEIDRVFVREQTFTLEQIRDVKLKDVTYITNSNNTSFVTGLCTGTIQSITPFSMTSEDIKTSEIEVGDYLKIGEYHSDWREFVVRRIKTVDKGQGTVTWDLPFSTTEIWHYKDLSDMVGAQFSVRRLGQVKGHYRELCKKFKDTNPNAELFVIGMSAFNNNDYCSAWGYNEAQQDIANEHNGTFVNISDEQVRFNDGALSDADAKLIGIQSTGSADYEVAGETVVNANRAMRVLVNGNDVTGIDAYVERTDGWYVSDEVAASQISLEKGSDWGDMVVFAKDYPGTGNRPIRIHFYANVPSAEDTIQLLVGGFGWSNDGVHQSDEGNQTYGSCILKAITQ